MREWGRIGAAFVVTELKCLTFPLLILLGLAVSRGWPHRYDAMLVYCLLVQIAMVRLGMETLSEMRAVAVFHALGLALEVQRTAAGAWSYPDPGWLRLGNVPLYSGFMYAGVASYLLQAWRRFDLTFDRLPPAELSAVLAVAGYASFFVFREWRTALILSILLSLARTWVGFTVSGRRLRMPLGLAFLLIGAAIWVGENAGTFLGAWQYPHQAEGWKPVEGAKAGAWFLLVVVGFLVVERFKAWEAGDRKGASVALKRA